MRLPPEEPAAGPRRVEPRRRWSTRWSAWPAPTGRQPGARDRPWERAGVIVAGAPQLGHDPATQLAVAYPDPAPGARVRR